MKKKRIALTQSVDSNIPHDRVVNIYDMADNTANQDLTKSYLELEKKAIGLSQTIDQLLKAVDEKDKEISHLKEMLGSMVPTIQTSDSIVSPITDEELIADIQISKLKEAAKIRDLTLDEIRKFDLLVKNKRLAQGDPTTINGENLLKQKSKPELIKLAAKKIIGDQ